MKRQGVVAITLIGLLSLLAGCSAASESPKQTDENVGAATPVSEQASSPSEQLSDDPRGNLTQPALEAKAIKVSLQSYSIYGVDDYPRGSVEVEYVICKPDDTAPASVKEIFENYNKWAQETSDAELKSADSRWEEYHKSKPDATIYLTPKVGMHLMRSDSSVISYAATRWCYNRDYEPDYNCYYGHTFDAQSGRELSLNDFVTDPEALADLLCEEFVLQSSGGDESERRAVYATPEFQKEIKDSILGCRDDGLFAWTVNPVGFVFYLSAPFYQEGYMLNPKDDVTIPFSSCKDILCQEMGASYDYISYVPTPAVDEMLGVERPLEGDIYGNWHLEYIGHIDGNDFLYLSGDDETLSYEIDGTSVKYLGRSVGSFGYPKMEYAEPVMDPQALDMGLSYYTLYELPELVGVSAIGDDGKPCLTQPYSSVYGSDPITTLADIKVEAFENAESTKSKKVKLPGNTALVFVRTDGESYIDVREYGFEDDRIFRLEIGGDEEDGYTVNGHPLEDVITTAWSWEG
jgi:hypothetical protein